MILFLSLPKVFSYTSTRMILAALTTLLITIFLGPYVINKLYALKTGQSIRVGDCPVLAELHEKKKETPTMGGILILLSMFVALALWMDLTSIFTYLLFGVTLIFGLIGVFDDYLKMKHKNAKGLRARYKFLLQVVVSGIIGAYLIWSPFGEEAVYTTYFLPFMKHPLVTLTGVWTIFGVLISMFVITGSSNAVNLTDGLDGLASGCLLFASVVFALIAFLSNNQEIAQYLNIIYIEGSGEIAIYLSALFGACLGFLWYNGHPAQVFMGDTGSLALGGILGLCSVLLRREILLALVGGIFVMEALSVILQVLSYRYRSKKRIFLCAPLHHHFEYKGWPETKVVVRFWIVGLVLALIGIVSFKFQ